MDKMIYVRDYDGELKRESIDTRENEQITFQFADDLDVNEFKIICIRMAQALGYAQQNIDESFGQPYYSDEQLDNRILKVLLASDTGLKNPDD